MINEAVQLQMNKVETKTSIISILCVILWKNSENTYFGHFLVENQDTGQKKSFRNSEVTIAYSLEQRIFP